MIALTNDFTRPYLFLVALSIDQRSLKKFKIMMITIFIISILTFVYLLYALIKPEKF